MLQTPHKTNKQTKNFLIPKKVSGSYKHFLHPPVTLSILRFANKQQGAVNRWGEGGINGPSSANKGK